MTATPTRTDNGHARTTLRLTPPPTRRRPALLVLALLLVVAGALGTASAVSRAGHRVAVLVLSRDVPEGAVITSADLTTADVSSSGLASIPASAAATVVGERATVALLAGTLLTHSALASGPALAPGEEVVGLALRSGQLPAEGLAVGDHVSVILTAAPGQAAPSGPATSGAGPGSVLVPDAVVYAIAAPGPSSGSNAAQVVSVEVPATLAGTLAAAGVAGQVALVLEAAP